MDVLRYLYSAGFSGDSVPHRALKPNNMLLVESTIVHGGLHLALCDIGVPAVIQDLRTRTRKNAGTNYRISKLQIIQ